ncbi:hypothetical protein [Streptomyces lunaelactis]|uniref:hypothetical protein n=1 Tax=Streptomyces lunaelactis TaxID=1535768 RepID=UPI001585887E|nr:hypothetical protein [Streptomyces lunaelactis]NUL13262.1 hypothetical protein [Streptomyces lunaelactis]
MPLEQLEAVLRESRARHAVAGDWDEDEFVANGEALQLVTHPDAPVATDADYGDTWTAWLDARIELNKRQGGVS